MSSRGVLVNNDSIESLTDFPTNFERPLTPRTPKSPKSPLPYNARDYFSHRGNVKMDKTQSNKKIQIFVKTMFRFSDYTNKSLNIV